jgi:hypothetical protein
MRRKLTKCRLAPHAFSNLKTETTPLWMGLAIEHADELLINFHAPHCRSKSSLHLESNGYTAIGALGIRTRMGATAELKVLA